MKKIILQMTIIFFLSLVVGIAYNQFSTSPLPIFKRYDPLRIDNPPGNGSGNAEPVYLEEIDLETMKHMVADGQVTPVDARTKAEFAEGHIPGAISLPAYEFDRYYPQVSALLAGKIVVTYCSSFDCLDSTLLGQELYRKGHTDIMVFRGGIDEWRQSGSPLEGAGSSADKGGQDER